MRRPWGWAHGGTTDDQFLKVIFVGLPALYFVTVVIPPVLFVKTIAQIRTLHCSRLEDQEMMSMWTRQDGAPASAARPVTARTPGVPRECARLARSPGGALRRLSPT